MNIIFVKIKEISDFYNDLINKKNINFNLLDDLFFLQIINDIILDDEILDNIRNKYKKNNNFCVNIEKDYILEDNISKDNILEDNISEDKNIENLNNKNQIIKSDKNYNTRDNDNNYTSVNIDKIIKKVFKKIAINSHPDKLIKKSKNNVPIFLEAREFYNNNKLIGLINCCIKLDINLEFIDTDNKTIEYILIEIRILLEEIIQLIKNK